MAERFGTRSRYDAVVVGAGPNGLSAALVLARAGLSTLVIEAKSTPGGGTRTEELTLPGFQHDVCSTVHPLGVASPFFRTLDLARRGVEWCEPPLALAHVLRDGRAVTLTRSLQETASHLGEDEKAYLALMSPFVERADDLLREMLGPLRLPRSPLLLARFGLVALGSLEGMAHRHFARESTRALLAGMGAHAMQPLDAPATASFGLVLGLAAHIAGWPVAKGGSQSITTALLGLLGEHDVDADVGERLFLGGAQAAADDHEFSDVATGGADPAGELDAVQARHVDVEDQQIELC